MEAQFRRAVGVEQLVRAEEVGAEVKHQLTTKVRYTSTDPGPGAHMIEAEATEDR